MKRKVRYGCFETNSSSQHSVIYKRDGRKPSELETKDNNLIIHVGNFTYGRCSELWTQKDKLGYLFTFIILLKNLENESEEEIVRSLKSDYDLWNLITYLLDYTKCYDIVMVKDEPLSMSNISDAEFAYDLFDFTWRLADEFLDFVFDSSIGMNVSWG